MGEMCAEGAEKQRDSEKLSGLLSATLGSIKKDSRPLFVSRDIQQG